MILIHDVWLQFKMFNFLSFSGLATIPKLIGEAGVRVHLKKERKEKKTVVIMR